jgi:hypothetical protein
MEFVECVEMKKERNEYEVVVVAVERGPQALEKGLVASEERKGWWRK